MRHPAFRHKASGFSLIEALITVAVFSIGLLGVAMTQYTALREQRNAEDFGSANEGMGYIAERMHINSAALKTSGSYTLPLSGVSNCTDDPNPLDPQEKQDIVRWQQMLCNAFGPGNVQAALQPVTGQSLGRWAMVVWQDRQQRGSQASPPPSDPNCPTTASQYPGLAAIPVISGQRCTVQLIVP